LRCRHTALHLAAAKELPPNYEPVMRRAQTANARTETAKVLVAAGATVELAEVDELTVLVLEAVSAKHGLPKAGVRAALVERLCKKFGWPVPPKPNQPEV
jgi:hypothetical protein